MIDEINGSINKRTYERDEDAYLDDDKWQTPREFENSNYGDCEDFAIAKYFKLKEAGVDVSKLRITAGSLADGQSHMVLMYTNEDGTISVLDNMSDNTEVNTDFNAIYSFNEDGLYAANGKRVSDGKRFNKWQNVLTRMANEEEIL